METIDVRDLPEPIAQVLRTMVDTLRDQLRGHEPARQKIKLPVWPGKVIGSLRREELYDDAL